MKNASKIILLLSLTGLLAACQVGTLTPTKTIPTPDLASIKTAAVQTASARMALTVAPIPLTKEAINQSPIPDQPTLPAASPFPSKLEALLQGKCEKVWESPVGPGVEHYLRETYGDVGCKLPVLSPDQKYLAYVTLAREDAATGPYFLDVVRLLEINRQSEKDQEVHLASKLDYIVALEWSPTGQLIIRESIWEGPWVIFVYDPVSNSIVSTMRLDTFGKLEWNPTHTALYAKHSFSYGAQQCITELGGYDFEHHSRFPDFYQIYHLEESKDDPFGIPHGENDDLAVEPFAWSQDGKRLWVTVTPLHWQEGQYELGPKQAGVLEFSTKVTYKVLAADAHLDYSFEGTPEPIIVSAPYRVGTCP